MINKVKKIVNISYSKLFDLPLPWNTVELYEAACKAGFNGIKGDVTPSSDGKLIMCHDSVFKFDENGRVFEPGSKGVYSKQICDMTRDECKKLEYASEEAKEHLGYYPKVTELEDLIKVCKKYDKFAYITVRDKQIQMCIDEIYNLLKKYNMTNQCIVNSFTYETLKTMKEKDPDVLLSYVWGPEEPLTKEVVDRAIELGNCIVCVFLLDEEQYDDEIFKKSEQAVLYAKEKGVIVHFARAENKEGYELGLKRGFTGFQCMKSDAFINKK